MKRFKTLLILTVFVLLFISLFTCYDCVAKGVTSGLYLCADVVIPSLFPVLCITSCFSYSGVINVFAKKLEKVSKKLFNTSGYFLPVFLLSLVSGYPVGASISQSLYKDGRISLYDRNNIACVSCSAGPGFVLLATGVAILHSFECGVVLLVCHLLASITVAVIISRFFKYTYFFESKNDKVCIGDALVMGVGASTSSIISICAYTVIFSAIINLLSAFLRETVIYLPLVSMLEVTNAVYSLASENVYLPFISAVLGFGGFSVIFQISSMLGNDRPPISRIIFIRLIHSFISFIYCSIAMKVFEITVPVAIVSDPVIKYSSDNFLFSFSLLILLIVFLGFFNKLIKKENFSFI